MELNGAHVVVTGASAGIGAAIAEELAKRGARLTLVARRAHLLEELAARLGARAVVADLAEDPTGWLAGAEEALGPVDVLVNNAGAQLIAPTDSLDVEAGERSLRLNLHAPLRLTRAVLPGMKARGRGAIVNVTSMTALAPTPSMTYYNASKAGLAAASEALRGELRGSGVSVLTVYPGLIQTQMKDEGFALYETNLALRAQPIGRPEVLARHIAVAVARDRARVIYPGVNALARMFPGPTRWVLDRFAPALALPSVAPTAAVA